MQAGAAAEQRSGAPVAWSVPPTQRVHVAGAPGSRTAVAIEAARGETESFQVAVLARGGALTGVGLVVSALTRGGGGVIGGRDIARFREVYVPVRRHSPGRAGRPLTWAEFPDALVPFVDSVTGRAPRAGARFAAAPVEVRAGRNQPYWVDVTVPRDAAPGVYRGRWTVRTAEGDVGGTVSLRVRDFALPVVPSSPSRFGLWQPANRTVAVLDLLARYRVEGSEAPPAAGARGRLPGPASVDVGFWSGADIETCTMRPPPPVEVVGAAAARWAGTGLRRYAYTADEVSRCPGLTPRLTAYGQALHAAGVDHLVVIVPREDLMDDGTGRPVVDTWVLLPGQLADLDPALRSRVLAAGGELWSYQALVGRRGTPSWQLDFPVTHYRVLGGFLNAAQGATGLLYWAVDRWQQDPWRDPTYTHTTSCCYPGDGQLVYPGRAAGVVGVVPSIRLAMVRDGMDDHDYVTLARARGLGAEVDRVLARAVSSWTQWSADGQVLADVRRELAEMIEASSSGASGSVAAVPIR